MGWILNFTTQILLLIFCPEHHSLEPAMGKENLLGWRDSCTSLRSWSDVTRLMPAGGRWSGPRARDTILIIQSQGEVMLDEVFEKVVDTYVRNFTSFLSFDALTFHTFASLHLWIKGNKHLGMPLTKNIHVIHLSLSFMENWILSSFASKILNKNNFFQALLYRHIWKNKSWWSDLGVLDLAPWPSAWGVQWLQAGTSTPGTAWRTHCA